MYCRISVEKHFKLIEIITFVCLLITFMRHLVGLLSSDSASTDSFEFTDHEFLIDVCPQQVEFCLLLLHGWAAPTS